MDQILNKVGSYWLGQKANKEINSVGDDINVSFLSIPPLSFWSAFIYFFFLARIRYLRIFYLVIFLFGQSLIYN